MQSTILPWFYAARPKTLSAALIPVLVGTILSPSIEWSYSFFALVGALFIQIGTNLVNDSMDFTRGADTRERFGPARATQMGWLTPHQVLAGGVSCFFVAALFTIPLIERGGWLVCVVLVLSVLSGYFYTAGPKPLAYQGLGELFVLLFFGWIGTFTMYYIQAQANQLSAHELFREHFWKAFLAGTQIGLLCTLILALNNLRDQEQDKIIGKRTLAVIFGTTFAKVEIIFLSLAPFLLSPIWWFFGEPFAALIIWIFLPLALNIVMGVWKVNGPELNTYFYRSTLLHLLFGCALSIGLLM